MCHFVLWLSYVQIHWMNNHVFDLETKLIITCFLPTRSCNSGNELLRWRSRAPVYWRNHDSGYTYCYGGCWGELKCKIKYVPSSALRVGSPTAFPFISAYGRTGTVKSLLVPLETLLQLTCSCGVSWSRRGWYVKTLKYSTHLSPWMSFFNFSFCSLGLCMYRYCTNNVIILYW